MKGDAGKWAERQVQVWLTSTSDRDATFAFHRFPDARAAQGALASQPSDHLVVHRGSVVFVETKETKELRRLPRAKVSQYGALLKMHLAGARVVVVVHRTSHSDWVLFTNKDLFDVDAPTSFPFEGHTPYPTASEALKDYFK